MNVRQDTHSLPREVRSKLREVRGLLVHYVGIRGVLLISLWALLVFWLAAAIDYLPVTFGASESPVWLRTVFLAVVGIGAAGIFLFWMTPRWMARLKDSSLALLIERQYPDFNNELITAVDLASDTKQADAEFSNEPAHAEMLAQVQQAVTARIDSVQPKELFNWQPVWGLGTLVALLVMVTLGVALSQPTWMQLWSQRFFLLSEAKWPRSAQLRADGISFEIPSFTGQLVSERVLVSFDDASLRVPAGVPLVLEISAAAGDKIVPEVCTMYYRGQDGTRGRANMRRVGRPQDGWQQFALDGPPLDSLSQDFELDIVGLDARLRDLKLSVTDSAILSTVELECVYPDYLVATSANRPKRERIPYRVGQQIPEGTQVSLVGESVVPLARVDYMILAAATSSGTDPSIGSSADRAAYSGDVQTVAVNAREFRIDLGVLLDGVTIELRLIDQYGLSADQIQRYSIPVYEDLEPEVEYSLVGIGNAITPSALIAMEGEANDDYGLSELTVELMVGEKEVDGIALSTDSPEFSTQLDLLKLAEVEQLVTTPGEVLSVSVSATDFYDLNSEPQIGRAPSQRLEIVSKDELLVRLDRQELELRQRLEQVISELVQLQGGLDSIIQATLPVPEAAFRKIPTSKPETVSVSTRSTPQERQAELSNEDQEAAKAAEARAQNQRLVSLRSQQAFLQGEKSQQELSAMLSRVENLRLQLVNNRIDSVDRQQRLQSAVAIPLQALLDNQYLQLMRTLSELQSAAISAGGSEQAQAAQNTLAEVLVVLEEIKANMLDIESFNEIVDLVRGLLEDQEEILEATSEKQKSQLLDILRSPL